jgi:(2Fe-2S) ferredoxin/SAM-dependent methyltransferase
MEPFRHHVFICVQQKLEDKPYCTERGGEAVFDELQCLVHKHKLDVEVQVTPCGCLGLCGDGPNMVVYPEGTWYHRVTADQVNEIVQSHFIAGKPVARLARHDMELMRREILRETALTRDKEVARQEAGVLPERMRRLADDFRASRAFLTAVELDLFTAVGDGATAHELAEHMGADPRATELLANALAASGILHKDGAGRFASGEDAGRYLRKGLPDDARAAIMHRVHMWDRWSTLTECVREGSAMGFEANAGPFSTQAYVAATHKIASLAAPALVAVLGRPRVTRVLDVGGGSGAYTVAMLRAHPRATAEILDLPPVLRIAGRYVREAGLSERVQLRAGDFMLDSLGSGFDLVLLSYVMHLAPPEGAKRLLARVLEALAPGGCVAINDFVLNAAKTLPRSAALHALNLLVSTRGGTVYSEDEYREFLEGAGFASVRRLPLLGPTDVMTAARPG